MPEEHLSDGWRSDAHRHAAIERDCDCVADRHAEQHDRDRLLGVGIDAAVGGEVVARPRLARVVEERAEIELDVSREPSLSSTHARRRAVQCTRTQFIGEWSL